jgi:hypothetical protein
MSTLHDLTPSVQDLRGDDSVPMSLPGDLPEVLEEMYLSEPELSDEELEEMYQYHQRQAMAQVAAGRVAAVFAVLSVLDVKSVG